MPSALFSTNLQSQILLNFRVCKANRIGISSTISSQFVENAISNSSPIGPLSTRYCHTVAAPNDVDNNVGDEAGLAAVTVVEELPEVSVRGLGNVKKAAINPLSIKHDVIAYVRADVEKQDLKSVRVKKRERKMRMKDLGNDVMAVIAQHKEKDNDQHEGSEDDDHIRNLLERHQKIIISYGLDD